MDARYYAARVRSASVALLIALALISGCGSKPPGITFDPPKPVINPTIALKVSPSAVSPGQSATVSWSATGTASCKATGAWSGAQAVSGTINVKLTSSAAQTYTLQCDSDSGGFAQQSVTLSLPPAEVCSPNAARAAGKRVGRRSALRGSHS
jgi:hypothetical protein